MKSKPLHSALLDKLVNFDSVIRTEYFGLSLRELADLMQSESLGIFAAEYEEVRNLALSGSHAKACKLYTIQRGCEMNDAVLAVDFVIKTDA